MDDEYWRLGKKHVAVAVLLGIIQAFGALGSGPGALVGAALAGFVGGFIIVAVLTFLFRAVSAGVGRVRDDPHE
jgi:hypothetical protein